MQYEVVQQTAVSAKQSLMPEDIAPVFAEASTLSFSGG
jgi:hypothetical protein